MPANLGFMLVDYRESKSKVPKFLAQLGVRYTISNLQIGDYAISRYCLLERKTINDFITSIADGRLFQQVGYLAQCCRSPLLVLEGGGLFRSGRVPANIIRGVMLWIAVTKKVPLLRTFNEYDTACTLRLLANKFSRAKNIDPESFQRQRRNTTAWQQNRDILVQIPNIGRNTAKELLKTFGAIANIVQASDAELLNVPGMGKGRIQAIRRIFPAPMRKG
jgi:ERCC4-type nuclease